MMTDNDADTIGQSIRDRLSLNVVGKWCMNDANNR